MLLPASPHSAPIPTLQGIVCSCMASTLILVGEVFSTLFLAVGEVGAILVRGVFALLVGICDVLAACACCCQVPFSERPDRNGYTYTTLALREGAPAERLADKPKFSGKAFTKTHKLFALPKTRKSGKSLAVTTENATKIPEAAPQTAPKVSTETTTTTEEKAKPQPTEQANKGWFGGLW